MNILSRKISRFALAATVAATLIGAPIALATSASAATSVSVVAKKAPNKQKAAKLNVAPTPNTNIVVAKACNTKSKLVCSQQDKNGNFNPLTLAKARPLLICWPGEKVNLGIVPSQTDACGRFDPSKIATAKPLVISFP